MPAVFAKEATWARWGERCLLFFAPGVAPPSVETDGSMNEVGLSRLAGGQTPNSFGGTFRAWWRIIALYATHSVYWDDRD
ncbi:MAG: hypothetical protein H5T64_13035 [Chloroflexi bacterium]|nr:hypothetical protein [Chloroflexota bacterium]